MFGRLLWKLLRGSRGRLAVAMIALVTGAAVISALLNLDFDIERKLTQEFRMLGANLVISAKQTTAQTGAQQTTQELSETTYAAPTLMDSGMALSEVERSKTPDLVAAAPYLYIVAREMDARVVVTGTWLDQLSKLAPTWKLEGNWIASRVDTNGCIIGRNVATRFGVAPGNQMELRYMNQTAVLTVTGVVDTGSTEDNQIFVNLPVAQNLAGLPGKIEVVQLSVRGTARMISEYASELARALPDNDVHPIRQVTEAEVQLLSRTRLLIVSMVLLILVLTALCVLATMATLAMDRRVDVGLMKALGGSISRIVGLFVAEVGLLGAMGGFVGCVAGWILSYWMGERVFGTSITPRWEIFPLTIALMVGVALAGALPLRALGRVKPAVILRGE